MSVETVEKVKLPREEVYRANAVKEGYVWSWDKYPNRYKLVAHGKLVGWFKTMREIKAEISELRFVAKGGTPREWKK